MGTPLNAKPSSHIPVAIPKLKLLGPADEHTPVSKVMMGNKNPFASKIEDNYSSNSDTTSDTEMSSEIESRTVSRLESHSHDYAGDISECVSAELPTARLSVANKLERIKDTAVL